MWYYLLFVLKETIEPFGSKQQWSFHLSYKASGAPVYRSKEYKSNINAPQACPACNKRFRSTSVLWAVLGQPSPLARVQTLLLSWLGCPAHAMPQHHGDSGTHSWSFSFIIFSKLSHGGLYTALNSAKLITGAAGCFRGIYGSWHRTEGHGGVPEPLEALSPSVPKHLLCTEGHTEYSIGETDPWGNDHGQLHVKSS